MALRMGELMVIVRAEDFASRTLRRVGGELAGMSRMQAQFVRNQQKLGGLGFEEKRLRTVAKQISLERRAIRIADQYETARRTVERGVQPGMHKAQVMEAQGAMSRLTREAAIANAELARHQKIFDRLPNRYRAFKNNVAGLGDAFRQNRVAQAQFTEQNRLLAKAIPIDKLDNFGRALSGVGRTMQLFGAVGTVAFGMTAAKAAEFATQASLAATQMRDLTVQSRAEGVAQIAERTEQLTNGLKVQGGEIAGILDLMGQYPAKAGDMTDAAYEIFSSMQLQRDGITDVAAGLSLLEKANQIAVASGTDLAEATDAMIIVLNNFDPQLKNVTEQFDTMFDIVRFGKMHLSDFAKMMIPLAPVAAGVGQSLEDIGGAMSFLTERMTSPERVATGLSRLLEALRHPDMVAGLKRFGIAVNQADGKMRPMDELLKDIVKRFPELRRGQKDAANFFRQISAAGRGGGRGQIFTIQGRRVFDAMMANFDEYLIRQKQIDENTGEFGTSLEAQLKTIGVQWEVFKNQISALAIVIGTHAVPVFAALGRWIEQFIQWFQTLSPETQELIIRIAAIAGVATLLAGVLATVLGAFTVLVARLRLLTISGGSAAGTLGTIAGFLRAIAPLAAIAIALKVLITGDMQGWDFLMAAAAGAGLGAMFGPAGMVVGGITFPIILKIMSGEDAKEQAFREWQKQFEDFRGGIQDKLGRFGFLNPFRPEFDRGEFERQWRIMDQAWRAKNVKGAGWLMTDQLKKDLKTVTPQMRKLFAEFGPQGEQDTKVKDYFETLKKHFDESKIDSQEFADELQALYDQQLTGTDDVINKQKELARVTRDARRNVINTLRGMFTEMLQLNQQAMGELFQGPWLTSETFDLAKEWGIEPRIEDMLLDLRQQNQRFAQWRKSLDALFKRGLPREFIQELQRMGPEQGQAFVDNLLKAKPGQVQAIIRQWKIRNEQIQEATKMDFTRQIEAFRKAGVDMGQAMINGFQDADVAGWFDSWVQEKFPDVINAAVNTAVTEWKKAQPPSATPGGGAPPIIKPGPTTGGTTTTTHDNSKKVEVNIASDSFASPDTAAAQKQAEIERARHAAFILTNAARRVFF